MYCSSCGTLNHENNYRCTECGHVLNAAAAPPQSYAQPQPPPPYGQPPPPPYGQQQPPPYGQQPYGQPQPTPPYGQQQPYAQSQPPPAYGHPPPYAPPHQPPAVWGPGAQPPPGSPNYALMQKSRGVAAVLQILLPCGIGRLYLGYTGVGIAQLLLTLFCGVGAIWAFVDGIIMLTGSPATDANGIPLKS